jgi:hypothetical protein
MTLFNHIVKCETVFDECLGDNMTAILVRYDDAFNTTQEISFTICHSSNLILTERNIRITGRAITGAIQSTAIVSGITDDMFIELLSNSGRGAARWIDDEAAIIGDNITLIESFNPVDGTPILLATKRVCEHPGLISMNILILDDSLDMNDPVKTMYVNLLTKDVIE